MTHIYIHLQMSVSAPIPIPLSIPTLVEICRNCSISSPLGSLYSFSHLSPSLFLPPFLPTPSTQPPSPQCSANPSLTPMTVLRAGPCGSLGFLDEYSIVVCVCSHQHQRNCVCVFGCVCVCVSPHGPLTLHAIHSSCHLLV